ncbi:MAG: histidine kinase [Ruminococcus sp.]|nr:histidine kinase [Ruminococcus sp.]
MIHWDEITAFALGGAMLVMMALGIVFSFFMPALDRWNKRYFVTLFSMLFLCVLSCFLAEVFWYDPTMAVTQRFIYFFESIFFSAPMFMPTILLLNRCGESAKHNTLFTVVAELLGIYFAMQIVTVFTNVFYYVTPDNQFVRGPLFPLWMSPLVVIMLLNIAGLFRRRKKLTKKVFFALLVYLLPMTATMIFHMFFPVETIIVSFMALFALIMFGLILSDNMEQYAIQQQEIADQRADIMVLQMRPHFIYNTMMTIYYLCKQDSDKAQEVTLNFTTYLRKNFTAIASKDTVPFSDELKHTQAYLTVEQAQHEDYLFVEFDTPHTRFRVPPLTLQPLVENAVKHGMNPDGDPLHIHVATLQTNSGSEIIVENDGQSFSPANDNEPHIALNNIRQRLEMMCKGTLTISERDGGGTVVKIFIPQ